MKLTLVTGNKGKLSEWQRLLPEEIKIRNHDVDLEEIQSLDLEEIALDKAKRAYKILKSPVVVEDISAGIQRINWLPGPFIKFFVQSLGENALFILAGKTGEPAKVACAIAYYDGDTSFTVKSEVNGIVTTAKGSNGFGFDKCFIPDGSSKTYGQMSYDEKDKVSHRSKAIKVFANRYLALG